VGPREALEVGELAGRTPTWCAAAPRVGDRVGAQVRAHGEELPAEVTAVDGAGLTVRLERPAVGVAAGQTMVLYRGSRVLGSATLDRPPGSGPVSGAPSRVG